MEGRWYPVITIEKYQKHSEQNSLIQFAKNKQQHTPSLPICPKCERMALRDVRDPREIREEFEVDDVRRMPITCPQCGYHGYTTVTARQYILKQLFK